jgi:segregation and condensation protein B
MTVGDQPPGGGPPKLRLVKNDPDTGAGPLDVERLEVAASADDGAQARSVEPIESAERREMLRVLEALLFSTPQALSVQKLAEYLPAGEDPLPLLIELKERFQGSGVNLVRVAGKWAFRTAPDLGYLLKREVVDERRLSKAALETLAIIAYHQPVTRAEIEEVRGVSTSAGTLDILLDTGWIRPRGRRRAPGRPVTYGTTDAFLEHFCLDAIGDLPGLGELRGAGLLSAQLPPDFSVPQPNDVAALMPDELPLEEDDEEAQASFDLEEDEDETEGVEIAEDAEGDEAAEGVDFAGGQALRVKTEADKPEPSSSG